MKVELGISAMSDIVCMGSCPKACEGQCGWVARNP